MMKKLVMWAVALPCVLMMSGCASYRLDRVDLLYLGQSYLPLPQEYPKDGNVDKYVASAPLGHDERDCSQPQPRWRNAKGKDRPTAMLLPGMTLRQVETTYERNRAFALPVISESQWTIPATGRCGNDDLWSRESLLRVRHLLSRAVGKSTYLSSPPDTDYYLEALRWAGCSGNAACSFTDVRKRFLEPFANALIVNYRDTGLTWQQDPAAPSEVIQTEWPDGDTNFTGWFHRVNGARAADFFKFPAAYPDVNDIGSFCARIRSRNPAARQFVDEKEQSGVQPGFAARAEIEAACNFNLKRLGIPGKTWSPDVRDPWVAKLTGGELTLLQTGDPLLMFRPAAHAEVLDSASRRTCVLDKNKVGSSLDCQEHQRLSQGFTDFELLFDISVGPPAEQVRVPITMTVAQFETVHGKGAKVQRIRRHAAWVPTNLPLIDLSTGTGTDESSRNFGGDGFIELRFMTRGSQDGWRHRGLYIHDDRKAEILLAPGDVLTVYR